LQARIDKALALADEWDSNDIAIDRVKSAFQVAADELRAALAAPTPATAEPPVDWVADVSREIRNSYCVCGHARDVHACKFTSVQCVVCGCTEFRDPPVHICGECADCLHDGNKCCGCYDNACCRATAERGEG
jgi:hypothetical protein